MDDVVPIYGKQEFEKFLTDYPVSMIEFYAPWCGHCKNLAPEYKKAATELKDKGIGLAAIDATLPENAELKTEYNIKGFPSLKINNTK